MLRYVDGVRRTWLTLASLGPGSLASEVRKCTFSTLSCPFVGNATNCFQSDEGVDCYCEQGYTGPLCASCDTANSYFLSSSRESCDSCNENASHVPTVLIGVVSVVFFVAIGGFIFKKRRAIESHPRVVPLMDLYRLASAKVRIFFFTFQASTCFNARKNMLSQLAYRSTGDWSV